MQEHTYVIKYKEIKVNNPTEQNEYKVKLTKQYPKLALKHQVNKDYILSYRLISDKDGSATGKAIVSNCSTPLEAILVFENHQTKEAKQFICLITDWINEYTFNPLNKNQY